MKIWIDITNSPHVMFFDPIIKYLRKKYKLIITARNYQQTISLLEEKNINYILLGRHHGKSVLSKISGVLSEVLLRITFIKNNSPDLVISHQSYYATIAARLMHKKSLYIFDGDTSLKQMLGIFWATKILCPDKLPDKIGGIKLSKYPGLKEEVYLYGFRANKNYINKLGLNHKYPIILIRPEAELASYIKKKGVLEPLLNKLEKYGRFQVIILPRTEDQKKHYKEVYKKFNIPDKIINGPNLIANVDLVISGGGTMNREAVVLGTPVISAFQNPPISVDKWLIEKSYILLKKNPILDDVIYALKNKAKYKMSLKGREKIIEVIEQMLNE
ncbi:MAG: DUF354 domain-containing protein [Promethearchaeota archaeon]